MILTDNKSIAKLIGLDIVAEMADDFGLVKFKFIL